MGQEEGRFLQVPERMGLGVFEGWRTRLPCSGAAAAGQKWVRDSASACVLGERRIRGFRCPERMRRVEGLGVTHFPTSARLPPSGTQA